MAIDFMAGELKLQGVFGTAMTKLPHYFTAFQSFVVGEAESDKGQFDLPLALEILAREANYRAKGATPQGLFLYQFESISRNRLGYDGGLTAMAQDPMFDKAWRQWILIVRRQVGLVDVADLIYVRSGHHLERQERMGNPADDSPPAVLVRPARGTHCAGQPAQGSDFVVCGLAPAVGLSRGATPAADRPNARNHCRHSCGAWSGWKPVSSCWRRNSAGESTSVGSTVPRLPAQPTRSRESGASPAMEAAGRPLRVPLARQEVTAAARAVRLRFWGPVSSCRDPIRPTAR